MKLLEKLRHSLFGEKPTGELYKEVLKNKKLNDNEKFEKFVNILGGYLITKQHKYLRMQTFENNFEDFFVNNVLNKELYNELYYEFQKEFIVVECIILEDFIIKLKNLNFEELSSSSKAIYKKVLQFYRSSKKDVLPLEFIENNYNICFEITNLVKNKFRCENNLSDEVDELFGF